MTDFRAARPWWSRRDFLKSSAAVAAGVYGMDWGRADAADPPLEFDGSKFLLKAADQTRSTAVSFAWESRCGRRISTSTNPAPFSISVRWDACSTI